VEKMGEGEGGGEGKNDYLYEVPHPTSSSPTLYCSSISLQSKIATSKA